MVLCKQRRPDQMPQSAASDQGLHCLHTNVSMENAVKMKTSTTRNGPILMIRMEKSTGQEGLSWNSL